MLEALRVASVWRHGNTSSHSTPVIPYARLAFAHTLNFLNEVGFLSRFLRHTHTRVLSFTLDGTAWYKHT